MINNLPSIQVYRAARHATSTAFFGLADARPIYAKSDDEALRLLRVEAHTWIQMTGFMPEDVITLTRPDQTIVRSWTLRELAQPAPPPALGELAT